MTIATMSWKTFQICFFLPIIPNQFWNSKTNHHRQTIVLSWSMHFEMCMKKYFLNFTALQVARSLNIKQMELGMNMLKTRRALPEGSFGIGSWNVHDGYMSKNACIKCFVSCHCNEYCGRTMFYKNVRK